MRICYHPTGNTLTHEQIYAWGQTTISQWPTPTVGTVLTIPNPTYPFKFSKNVDSEDRVTLGGVSYSKIKYSCHHAQMSFDSVKESELSSWVAWYDATSGFRIPFIVEKPLTVTPYLMSGQGDFPLTLEFFDTYSGTLNLKEYL